MRARGARLALLLALAGAALLRAGAGLVCPAGECAVPRFDRLVLAACDDWRVPLLDAFFRAVTWAGSLYVLAPLAALVAWQDFRAGRRRAALFLPLALAFTWAGVHTAKLLVARPRPDFYAALGPLPPDGSFPSAHAAQVVAFALAWVLRPDMRCPPLALPPLALLVGLVMLSRLYLQVHYPSDVLFGAMAAALWVTALRVAPPFAPARS